VSLTRRTHRLGEFRFYLVAPLCQLALSALVLLI
jgi:hypothetical protein